MEKLFLSLIYTSSDISLRLQGPLSANGTGRVEIFYHGQWGTICDDFWSIYGAHVACRQLGYHYAVRALHGYEVPDGTGQIWLDNVGCNGKEHSLSSCYHRGWGNHNCGHRDDAGVECSTTGRRFHPCYFEFQFLPSLRYRNLIPAILWWYCLMKGILILKP